MTPIRPKFENPPLIERAVTVMFEPLTALSIGDYGLFWAKIRDEFPISEAMPLVAPEIEQFGSFRPVHHQIQLIPENTLPRVFFRNPEKGELIQLQPDRFSFNWIKTSSEHCYPHSEKVLSMFFALFDTFSRFVAERQLGEIVPIQCEITNVNVVPVADVGDTFADFATVIKLPDLRSPAQFLPVESQVAGAKHLILDDAGEPIGRVHSVGQPSLRILSNELAYRLDIVARGAPIGPGRAGVEHFFEKAVSAINGVFLASVTQVGRQFWGEQNG